MAWFYGLVARLGLLRAKQLDQLRRNDCAFGGFGVQAVKQMLGAVPASKAFQREMITTAVDFYAVTFLQFALGGCCNGRTDWPNAWHRLALLKA